MSRPILVVRARIDDAVLPEFEKWYREVHLPPTVTNPEEFAPEVPVVDCVRAAIYENVLKVRRRAQVHEQAVSVLRLDNPQF